MSPASLICLSKDIIKQINSIICSFIWKGKDKIRRLTIISDYKNGGLRMPHLQTLIDTQRIIQRVLKNIAKTTTTALGSLYSRLF